MNSRSSVNETNLVNFSADLSSLNQLDTKDGLLSFPFDHIYACHSEGEDRRQNLQLDKEVEISTHCVVGEDKDLVVSSTTDLTQLTSRLNSFENQNKKLKDLLVYHLDLIQQQNEIITKRDKLYQALKQENDTLKSRLSRTDRRLGSSRSANAPSAKAPAITATATSTTVSATATSTVIKTEHTDKISLNNFDLLLPDRSNPYLFESDIKKNKSFGQDHFEIPKTESESDLLQTENTTTPVLENNLNEKFNMIDSKRSYVNKEMKVDSPSDALYTVTSNSGNPVFHKIQRNKRRATGLSNLSRFSKIPKVEAPESSNVFDTDMNLDRDFSVNKKSKMINTYGKNKNVTRKTSQFTGSLSDRLQLIDTTPTGEDPYQLGEADMREQSPIPKLMLQKSHHGKMKICTETGETTTRLIYEPIPETITKPSKPKPADPFDLSLTFIHREIKKEPVKTLIVEEPDLNIVKTEPEIDWRIYDKPEDEASLCDFSFGDNPTTIDADMPSLDSVDFTELFRTDATLNLDGLNSVAFNTDDKNANDKSKNRSARMTNLVESIVPEMESSELKRGIDVKRGRKRALSATGVAKGVKRENAKSVGPKPKINKGKPACRGKKSPVPGMTTDKPYHTLVGDPDMSWYFGLDPDVKIEDFQPPTGSTASTVEVPRWREKPFTSCYSLEGTENLDDKVYEKRHQKLEAEERRQLRWHMRRIREQRHVERLRQRQRDSWCGGGSPHDTPPSFYTIWPQAQRDLRFIQITDTLPVFAFGEVMPSLQEADFMLPWVRTSKALKRSKRAKTLH